MTGGPAWWFYQIEGVDLSVALLPLLEKSLERGWRIGILSPREERLSALDNALWVQEPAGFLPHGRSLAESQPIFLTDAPDDLMDRDAIVLLDGADWDRQSGRLNRLMVLFEADDLETRTIAREQYRRAKGGAGEVSFFVYRPGEGWTKQA